MIAGRLNRILDTFREWKWQYIYYPVELILDRKNLFGEEEPFEDVFALICNRTSKGPLLPRVGDSVLPPSIGASGHSLIHVIVKAVEFELPFEELTKNRKYRVFLDTERYDDYTWEKIVKERNLNPWSIIEVSKLLNHRRFGEKVGLDSRYLDILPGARFCRPDYVDKQTKQKELAKLMTMSKAEISSKRERLLYLRHHYPEAEGLLG